MNPMLRLNLLLTDVICAEKNTVYKKKVLDFFLENSLIKIKVFYDINSWLQCPNVYITESLPHTISLCLLKNALSKISKEFAAYYYNMMKHETLISSAALHVALHRHEANDVSPQNF